MSKVIVYVLLLDLFSVTLQISDFQENTIVSSSNQINCDGNTTITIVALNVQQYSTSCSQFKHCNVTEQQSNDIKKSCNKKTSCTISTIIPNSCVFNDYGQVSVSYSCTEIVNSSCNFESGVCGWTINGTDRYKWKLQTEKTPETDTGPDIDHTTASAINCNFETGQCGWKSEETTYQWKNWYHTTPFYHTGPDFDHTLGTSAGGYIYLEASGISNGQRSNLTSETVYPDGDACLNFWYCMYGGGMGTLNVYLDSEELSRIVWSKSGNRNKRWWLASIDISTSGPYKIIFEGIRGSSLKSGIALDDISLFAGSCKEAIVSDCSFEVGNCYWSTYPETTNIWTITNRPTSSDEAGPYIDHTTGSADGHYIYLERTDLDLQEVVKSNLTSFTISPGGDICITFWYHMYGENIGTLNVYTESGNTTEKHWSQSGNQENVWQFAYFDISKSEPYRIIFEGVRGDDDWSDISLDDILLLQRTCSAFVLDCSFEDGKCYWSNYPDTQYIWQLTDTPILTSNAGPFNDHTTGSADGHYIYLDQTGLEGVKYKLTSLTISPAGDICISFWYHMYGENIGTLNVYTESFNTTEKHWSQSGNHGNSWQFAYFDISKFEPYRIIFEGVRGDDVWSDIALDDIFLLQRSCSDSATRTETSNKNVDKVFVKNSSKKRRFRSGLNNSTHTCNTTDEISLPECSKYYLQLNKTSVVFNPKFDDCSADYQEIQTSIINLCNDMDNSDICTFNLFDVIKKDIRCVQANRLLVEYRCEVSAKNVSLPTVMNDSSDSETGLVVGLVVVGLLLICVVILIVVLVRRHILGSGSKEQARNDLRGNDYIGCQDIALPQAADHSSHMQSVGMYGQSSSINTNTHTQINNAQHTCTNLGIAKEFLNNKQVQSPANAVSRVDSFADNQTSNGDEYAMVDPIAETSFSETKHSRTGTTDSYMVLDQNDTGFNGTQLSKTPTGYEFANPVKDTENESGEEDKYALSEEGVYDQSGSNRHKELEDNIYNHADDTIYNSGSHKRNDEGREDTYDHFFGQKTEDDYDISTTT